MTSSVIENATFWLVDTIHYYTKSVHGHVFNSRCSVAAFKGAYSPSSGFPNYFWPQLPTSHSNGSQVSTSSDLTESPINWLHSTHWLTVIKPQSQQLHDWQFTTNQFILVSSSLRLTARDFFFLQMNPCGYSPYVTSSLMRGWVCLLWTGFAFVKCTYCIYIAFYWKFFLEHYIQVLLSVQPAYNTSAWTTEKTPFLCCCLWAVAL
jgi:hypothetical protein